MIDEDSPSVSDIDGRLSAITWGATPGIWSFRPRIDCESEKIAWYRRRFVKTVDLLRTGYVQPTRNRAATNRDPLFVSASISMNTAWPSTHIPDHDPVTRHRADRALGEHELRSMQAELSEARRGQPAVLGTWELQPAQAGRRGRIAAGEPRPKVLLAAYAGMVRIM